MAILDLFKRRHRDRFEWHETLFAPPFARDMDGKPFATGAVIWRRRKADDSGWEYRQEPESYDDWAQRVGW